MLNIFINRLFGKLFILIFLAIVLIVTTFAVLAVDFQKRSILDSLSSEAKSIADSISFVKKDDMIIDNEIEILEFTLKFVNQNEQIKSFIVSRKDSYNLLIKKNQWKLIDGANLYKVFEQNISNSQITLSQYSNEKVFKYTYPIYIQNILWGWYHIELSLEEYNKKVDLMYENIIFLAFVMLFTSIFLSYLITSMITTPIIKLSKVSSEISNGDLSQRVDIKANDEIGYLAVTFNNMLNSLESSQKELKKAQFDLERRVELRTQELKNVNDSLEEKSKELKELNENLEYRVISEVSKRQKQEQLLIQQSKLAAMGEMIGNIAHQWRQPLNALSLVLQNIHFSYKINDLNDEFMDNSMQKANLLTNTMSKTIDDFRNFFKPNKEKKVFSLNENIIKTVSMVDSSLENNNIELIKNINQDVYIFGFPNEFSQVILNIINNAKDALIENNIENKKINIDLSKDLKYAYIIIRDNAGGIPNNIIGKIYDPYFTTKEEGKGTGIGLYMSKTIIEENMQGYIFVENVDQGAKFTIKIPIKGES
jgi:signal transduction histidine kinase